MENKGLSKENIITIIAEYLNKEKKITGIARQFHPVYGKTYFNGFLPPGKQNNLHQSDQDTRQEMFSG